MRAFEKSSALYAEACKVLADGVSSGIRKSVTPLLYFDRADGPYYYDVDGNEYVDYTLAWGPLIAGANHPRLNAAVTDQLSRSYTLGAQHELEIALARRMVACLPGVEQVLFCNTGTEAVQVALRLARAATGRDKIVKFEGHYHGWANNVLVSYHPGPEQLGTVAATCRGQPPNEYRDTLVLPWNDLGALEQIFVKYPGQIACVITEPILANSGSCMPREGFLEGLIGLCRDAGAVSVFDEVITGFRIALGGAREYFGLAPDLSTYAKALAGGFTMGAVGGTTAMFDALRDGRTLHAGTYNGSSINLAATLATLDLLAEPGAFDRMQQHGREIRKAVELEARTHEITLVTTGTGTVFSVHFGQTESPRNYADTLKTDTSRYAAFRDHMLHDGIHLLPDGRWYVGLAHAGRELEKTRAALRRSMAAIAQGHGAT